MAQNALLKLVQRACGELGVPEPTSVVGNATDDIAAQMYRLANRVGEDLQAFADWSFLIVEGATLTMVSGQESYSLPSDFDRLVSGTTWDRTNRWRTLGPDNAEEARWRRESTFGQSGPRRALRQVGSTLTVYPVPAASGDVLAFDYVSSNFALSSATPAVAQSEFLADTDTALFGNDLMVMGLKWRWMAAKGMDATFLKGEYDAQTRISFARDQGGGKILNMAGRSAMEHGNADDVVAGAPVVILGTSGGAGIAVD